MKFLNSAAAIGAAASVLWPRCDGGARAFVVQLHPLLLTSPPCLTVAYAKNKSGGGFGSSGGGGGFGGGGGTSAPSQKKSAKKRKRSDMQSLLVASKKEEEKKKTSETNAEPQLDRFGLPIPTEDDVFPPLPFDTELTVVQEDEVISMTDIRTAMKDHVQFNFDLFNDEDCVEKNPTKGASPMKLRLLHRSPPVLAIENFFTDDECDQYIALSSETNNAEGTLKVDSKTFSLSLATRTSTTWFLHYRQVPNLLAKASRLLADLPIERIEEPQLVRYKTGEQFSYHYDAVPDEELDRNGGQRVATLLVYLRTIEEGRGGATQFRDLRDGSGNTLSTRPTKGSALLFFPAFDDGRADDRTLHKGEIAVDEKMIGQIWVHQGKYNPAVPEGNSHFLAQDAVAEKRKELGYETIV
mmetsp:Transcript_18818/g.54213  ORF Transcript_18818/g.54213 Transcript_18818/m.54213 type:complete len:411 (-) Transcript_18818:48-1280(-)